MGIGELVKRECRLQADHAMRDGARDQRQTQRERNLARRRHIAAATELIELAAIPQPAQILSLDLVGREKTGRASCRDRVWQAVYITVVAVSLKNKTMKHTTQNRSQ